MKHDKKNITAMVTGMVIGAALASEAAAGIVAEPTWQKIYVDGRQVSMTAYNIAGNNYVRLRDIGQQVDFNVYWSDGVQIDTDAPYTGIAPVQEISSQPTRRSRTGGGSVPHGCGAGMLRLLVHPP